MKKQKDEASQRVSVSVANVRRAAVRLIPLGSLVSAEIDYVQRTLGDTATQSEIDASVVAVRKLPWSSIVVPD